MVESTGFLYYRIFVDLKIGYSIFYTGGSNFRRCRKGHWNKSKYFQPPSSPPRQADCMPSHRYRDHLHNHHALSFTRFDLGCWYHGS